jgi:hypothetical protein
MAKSIYIVQGDWGEMDKYEEWVVCAYYKESKARKHVLKAREWRKKNVTWRNQCDKNATANPYDDSEYGRLLETSWTFYEIELRTKLPKPK